MPSEFWVNDIRYNYADLTRISARPGSLARGPFDVWIEHRAARPCPRDKLDVRKHPVLLSRDCLLGARYSVHRNLPI